MTDRIMNIQTLGILGSGQLGRMLAIAASEMGISTHIYAPDAAGSPAGEVASTTTTASYDDEAALRRFGEQVDAVISEFENMPASSMAILAEYCDVAPGKTALYVAQNRLREKQLARQLGIRTAEFHAISSAEELAAAMAGLNGGQAILKTAEMGYDGKGQVRLPSELSADQIWDELGCAEAILEHFVEFTSEISVLVWRTPAGQSGCFPVSQNHHRNGILCQTIAPAPDVDEQIAQAARNAALALADATELTGVMAMEAFVTSDGEVLFNELAPRPHNSFHWTIEGCLTSQFAQAVRVICGWAAGDVTPTGTYVMDNLLGEDMDRLESLRQDGGGTLHLYGKNEARQGRKMGHYTYRRG